MGSLQGELGKVQGLGPEWGDKSNPTIWPLGINLVAKLPRETLLRSIGHFLDGALSTNAEAPPDFVVLATTARIPELASPAKALLIELHTRRGASLQALPMDAARQVELLEYDHGGDRLREQFQAAGNPLKSKSARPHRG
jgi:hypothetical protein